MCATECIANVTLVYGRGNDAKKCLSFEGDCIR